MARVTKAELEQRVEELEQELEELKKEKKSQRQRILTRLYLMALITVSSSLISTIP